MNLLSVNKHLFFPNFQYFYDPDYGKLSHSVMLSEYLEARYIVKFSGGFAPRPSAPAFQKVGYDPVRRRHTLALENYIFCGPNHQVNNRNSHQREQIRH